MEENKYVIVGMPMKPELKEAILAMKGPERSMSEYAEASGVSKTMLSRMTNGNYARPFSKDIMIKLFENADPNCSIPLETLMHYNGMATEKAAERIELRNRMAHINYGPITEKIVIEELFKRGILIQQTRGINIFNNQLLPRMLGDIIITTPETGEPLYWEFKTCALTQNSEEMPSRPGFIQHFLRMQENLFLADAWYPEETRHIKTSLVYFDEVFFNEFVETMSIAKLNNRFSAILIDLNSSKVVKEFLFPCKNFPNEKSIFDLPTIDVEDFFDDIDEE